VHQAVKKNVRSVGADVSEKVFEQHVDFFRVHVLAHVFDPYDRDAGVPKVAMSHRLNLRAAANSLNTVFDPAHALPDIIEDREYLVGSRAAVTAYSTNGGKQLASGNYFIGGLGDESEMLGGAKAKI
jgi:hypothetical protein